MVKNMEGENFPRYRLGMGIWDGLQNRKLMMENRTVNLRTEEL